MMSAQVLEDILHDNDQDIIRGGGSQWENLTILGRVTNDTYFHEQSHLTAQGTETAEKIKNDASSWKNGLSGGSKLAISAVRPLFLQWSQGWMIGCDRVAFSK
jgi:hypothetical protein